YFCYFFFFQAEDGIRDKLVTGVQTCALPIFESDTGDKIVVFTHDALGNVAPARFLHTPHRGYGIAVDESKPEMFVTVEYPPKVKIGRASCRERVCVSVVDGSTYRR